MASPGDMTATLQPRHIFLLKTNRQPDNKYQYGHTDDHTDDYENHFLQYKKAVKTVKNQIGYQAIINSTMVKVCYVGWLNRTLESESEELKITVSYWTLELEAPKPEGSESNLDSLPWMRD